MQTQKKRNQLYFHCVCRTDDMIPHSIIAFGYPVDSTFEERDQMEPDKVHYEKW